MKKEGKENTDQNLSDNNREKPKIFGIRKRTGIVKDFSRKDFITLGLSVTAGLFGAAAVSSCGSDTKETPDYSDEKNSTCASTISYSHYGNVASIAVSPDGSILASGSADCTVKLWSLPEGTLSRKLTGHTKTVLSLAISPDGTKLASGGSDAIKIWSISTGELLATLDEEIYSRNSLRFSNDNSYLISCNYYGPTEQIKLWNIPGYTKSSSLTVSYDFYGSLAVNKEGTLLASGISGNKIKIWNFPAMTEVREITSGKSVLSLAFCPDGSLVSGEGNVSSSSAQDCSVKVWNLTTGNCLNTLTGHTRDVSTICVNSGGTVIATGSYDGTIKLWQLTDGSLLNTLNGHGSSIVEALAMTPDGTSLISGGDDKNINLWNISAGSVTKVIADSDCKVDVYVTCGTNNTNSNCSCNTVCSCDAVCSCNSVCTCNSQGGGGGGGYWYPN